ncbi:MAG: hypothetical protein K1X35_06020 [Caulobacteraceae bacterium]|nr:hypothetical protein [Caulobacteraceae bacterium]
MKRSLFVCLAVAGGLASIAAARADVIAPGVADLPPAEGGVLDASCGIADADWPTSCVRTPITAVDAQLAAYRKALLDKRFTTPSEDPSLAIFFPAEGCKAVMVTVERGQRDALIRFQAIQGCPVQRAGGVA